MKRLLMRLVRRVKAAKLLQQRAAAGEGRDGFRRDGRIGVLLGLGATFG